MALGRLYLHEGLTAQALRPRHQRHPPRQRLHPQFRGERHRDSDHGARGTRPVQARQRRYPLPSPRVSPPPRCAHRRRALRRGQPTGAGAGFDPGGAGGRSGQPAERILSARHTRPPHPAGHPRPPAAVNAAACDPRLQGHEPADEGQVARPPRPGLHLRQGPGLRHALHRQADDRRNRLRGDQSALRAGWQAARRRSADRGAAAGQRELRAAQRQQVGAGNLPPRRCVVRPHREADLLWHQPAECRAVVRPPGPDGRRHQACHAFRHRRHRQDAPGASRRPRMPAALPADHAGSSGSATVQPRPRLPARRHQRQTRPLHAAALRQPHGDPPPVRRGLAGRPQNPGDA